MDKGLITEQTLSDIASAIRDVYGESDTYYPSEFADKIRGLVFDPYAQGLWVDYGNGYVTYSIEGTVIPSSEFRSNASLIGAKWNQCTSIGNSAFYRCSALTEVSFPACTSINTYVFYSCSSLTKVSFPACKSIGNDAFEYCYSLTEVSFPACTSINTYAFYGCSSLTKVSLPACTTIGSAAFGYCTSLSEARFMAGKVVSLGNSQVFYATHASLKIYVPSSLYSAYLSATYWSLLSSRLYSA